MSTISPNIGSNATNKRRPMPAKARELFLVRVGNLRLRFHSLKTGTEVYCQFCFIRIFIKKHKRPRKGKWLRLLECIPLSTERWNLFAGLSAIKNGAGEGNRTLV
ncbi:MAG: hypothetical protein ABSF10_15120 [Verrucomicrobiota bacterium]